MRIEGEKGVKTQSAPKHWPRTRKRILAEQFNLADRYGRAGKESSCSAGFSLRDRNVRATHEPGRSRDRPNRNDGTRPTRSAGSYRNGPTSVDPGNSLGQNKFGRPNRSTATKSIGHRPKTFLGQGKSPFH
ncbi:unnamed protein product [Microthlaspi erraticum]|uniref:Uncharacterized protein n=1 Tax=Microthlaspi erraticum TaxID=1685480 RepID=A0A6D2I775_9BRAS|nr:unnamed protein product [Microthlaspi erraticum]